MQTVADRRELQAGLAAIYVLTGNPASAIVQYDELEASRPSNVRWSVDKAVALDLLGRHDEAQALYHGALQTTPNDPVVITDLALSLALSGKSDQARALVAPLRDAGNLPPRVRNNIDVVLAASGKPGVTPQPLEDRTVQKLAQALGGSFAGGPARSP